MSIHLWAAGSPAAELRGLIMIACLINLVDQPAVLYLPLPHPGLATRARRNHAMSLLGPDQFKIIAYTISPPVSCNKSNYLKILRTVCLVIRVYYVSRPNTLKSWISEIACMISEIIASLRSRAFHTHFSTAEIIGI